MTEQATAAGLWPEFSMRQHAYNKLRQRFVVQQAIKTAIGFP